MISSPLSSMISSASSLNLRMKYWSGVKILNTILAFLIHPFVKHDQLIGAFAVLPQRLSHHDCFCERNQFCKEAKLEYNFVQYVQIDIVVRSFETDKCLADVDFELAAFLDHLFHSEEPWFIMSL